MDGKGLSDPSEFQRTLSLQIALYEADLEGLRLNGAGPDEISAFELIVGELHRLQTEDLTEITQAALWRAGPAA